MQRPISRKYPARFFSNKRITFIPVHITSNVKLYNVCKELENTDIANLSKEAEEKIFFNLNYAYQVYNGRSYIYQFTPGFIADVMNNLDADGDNRNFHSKIYAAICEHLRYKEDALLLKSQLNRVCERAVFAKMALINKHTSDLINEALGHYQFEPIKGLLFCMVSCMRDDGSLDRDFYLQYLKPQLKANNYYHIYKKDSMERKPGICDEESTLFNAVTSCFAYLEIEFQNLLFRRELKANANKD